MEKKLIVLDIDGTLVDQGMPFSSMSKEILSKLISLGHEVVLASGRPIRSIIPYYLDISSSSLIIAYNGLWVGNPKHMEDEISYAFQKEVIQQIYEELLPYVDTFMAESESTIYSSIFEEYLDKYFPYEGMKKEIGNNLIFKEDLLTCLFKIKEGQDEIVEKIIAGHKGYILRHWNNSPYGEISRIGFNKGSALKLIQDKLSISKANTISIGDSDNDFEMLSSSGLAFYIKGSKSKRLQVNFKPTKRGLEEDGAARMLSELLLFGVDSN